MSRKQFLTSHQFRKLHDTRFQLNVPSPTYLISLYTFRQFPVKCIVGLMPIACRDTTDRQSHIHRLSGDDDSEPTQPMTTLCNRSTKGIFRGTVKCTLSWANSVLKGVTSTSMFGSTGALNCLQSSSVTGPPTASLY